MQAQQLARHLGAHHGRGARVHGADGADQHAHVAPLHHAHGHRLRLGTHGAGAARPTRPAGAAPAASRTPATRAGRTGRGLLALRRRPLVPPPQPAPATRANATTPHIRAGRTRPRWRAPLASATRGCWTGVSWSLREIVGGSRGPGPGTGHGGGCGYGSQSHALQNEADRRFTQALPPLYPGFTRPGQSVFGNRSATRRQGLRQGTALTTLLTQARPMRGAPARKPIENKALHPSPAQVAPVTPLDCTPRLWLRCAAAGLQAQAAIHPSQENTMTTANPRLTDHPEEAAVRVPLELYMRGHAEDNSAHMRAAFMPTARIESVREGPLTSWDIDTYCARFKASPPPTRPRAAAASTPSTSAARRPAPRSPWCTVPSPSSTTSCCSRRKRAGRLPTRPSMPSRTDITRA